MIYARGAGNVDTTPVAVEARCARLMFGAMCIAVHVFGKRRFDPGGGFDIGTILERSFKGVDASVTVLLPYTGRRNIRV